MVLAMSHVKYNCHSFGLDYSLISNPFLDIFLLERTTNQSIVLDTYCYIKNRKGNLESVSILKELNEGIEFLQKMVREENE
jgi:hypothetical protein